MEYSLIVVILHEVYFTGLSSCCPGERAAADAGADLCIAFLVTSTST